MSNHRRQHIKRALEDFDEQVNTKGRIIQHSKTIILVVIAAGLASCLTFINHEYLNYDNDAIDIGSWGAWFTCYGVIYAIIMGFLLANVLQRFSDLSQTIQNELNAIECCRDSINLFYQLLQKYNNNNNNNNNAILNRFEFIHQSFLQSLCNYLIYLRDIEWLQMAKFTPKIEDGNDSSSNLSFAKPMNSDTSKELEDIYNNIGNIILFMDDSNNNLADKNIVSLIMPSIMSNINDLSKYRTQRIGLSNDRLPQRLKFLTVWMTLFLLVGFVLMQVLNVYINLFMTIGISTSIHWLYDIVSDMDHPFFGVWNIDGHDLNDLIESFITKYNCNESKAIIQRAQSIKKIDNNHDDNHDDNNDDNNHNNQENGLLQD